MRLCYKCALLFYAKPEVEKSPNIGAEKVTKPIQLLAAWLAGLVLVNGTFLTAAKVVSQPSWLPAVLVIASVVNVFVFLACMFILQTKFRTQLQEDSYYSQFLRETGERVSWLDAIESLRNEVSSVREQHIELASAVKVIVQVPADGVEGDADEQAEKLDAPSPRSGDEVPANADSNCAVPIGPIVAQAVPNQCLSAVGSAVGLAIRTYAGVPARSFHRIWVNDLIPGYPNLVKDLIVGGFTIEKTFGSSSYKKRAPDPLVVTIGETGSMAAVKAILQLAARQGFRLVALSRGPSVREVVLLGAYSYEVVNVAPVDIDVVLTLLDSDSVTWEALAKFFPTAVVPAYQTD